MKNQKRHQAESGQSLVIIAMLMVGLLAIVGLAIDGGGLLLLRRDTQNAVDSAVVAAAYARCTRGDVELAARTAARDNGYTQGKDNATVTINRPPLAGPKAGDPEFIEVIITKEKPKYFIQLVYTDPLVVTARGVGYCKPGSQMFAGAAIFAASEVCSNAADFSGSSSYIEGNVHSNNDIKFTGSNHQVHGTVTAVNGVGGSATFDPSANNPKDVDPYEDIPLLYDVKDFKPGGKFAAYAESQNGGATNFTGRKGEYYYFAGDITLPGDWSGSGPIQGLIYATGSVTLKDIEVGPKGLTVVSDNAAGQIQQTQQMENTVVKAYLPNGLLYFSTAKSTTCGVSNMGIQVGGSNNRLFGLLYAPYGPIKISGSKTRIEGALIANTVDNAGSDTVVIYDPFVVPPIPPEIVVAE